MRPSSVQKRTELYLREFSIDAVRGWFRDWEYPIVFAVVIGKHTGEYGTRHFS